VRPVSRNPSLTYYHFKGKDDLFSHILETSFKEYFSRLEALEREPGTPFQRIEALLNFHLQFAEEMPDETAIDVSTSPAKLKDPGHTRTKNVRHQRKKLKAYLKDCLKKGIKSGEFNRVPVPETVDLLIAMINGVLRQRGLWLEEKNGMANPASMFVSRARRSGFQ
jgi:AcrR family transcriptional regulator